MSVRLWLRLFLVVIVVLIISVGFLLYRDHQRYTLESALVPIVKPDTAETKVPPVDPEGMDIPNTELSVYEHLDNPQKIPPATALPNMPKNNTNVEQGAANSEDAIPPAEGALESTNDNFDIPFIPASSLQGSVLDMGLFATQEEATQTWARAKAGLPQGLEAAHPQMVRDQGGYHLYIVDLPNQNTAQDVCDLLTKIGLLCQVTGDR